MSTRQKGKANWNCDANRDGDVQNEIEYLKNIRKKTDHYEDQYPSQRNTRQSLNGLENSEVLSQKKKSNGNGYYMQTQGNINKFNKAVANYSSKSRAESREIDGPRRNRPLSRNKTLEIQSSRNLDQRSISEGPCYSEDGNDKPLKCDTQDARVNGGNFDQNFRKVQKK